MFHNLNWNEIGITVDELSLVKISNPIQNKLATDLFSLADLDRSAILGVPNPLGHRVCTVEVTKFVIS